MATTTILSQNELLDKAVQLSKDTEKCFHHYLHLGLEYLRIPEAIIYALQDFKEADGSRPYYDAIQSCMRSYDFYECVTRVDERIEAVDGPELIGRPDILWMGFAVQRAYYNSLNPAYNGDMQLASRRIVKGREEFVELKEKISKLEKDVLLLKKGRKDNVDIDLTQWRHIGTDVRAARWIHFVGDFMRCTIRFKGEPVKPPPKYETQYEADLAAFFERNRKKYEDEHGVEDKKDVEDEKEVEDEEDEEDEEDRWWLKYGS